MVAVPGLVHVRRKIPDLAPPDPALSEKCGDRRYDDESNGNDLGAKYTFAHSTKWKSGGKPAFRTCECNRVELVIVARIVKPFSWHDSATFAGPEGGLCPRAIIQLKLLLRHEELRAVCASSATRILHAREIQ